MDLTAPDLEKRLTELQSQVNRLSLSLHLWQERQDRLFEQRLTDWSGVEARVQRDASLRLEELQRTIEREWIDRRNGHDDPGQQIRQLETNLGDRLTVLADQVREAVAALRAMPTLSPPASQGLQTSTPAAWPLDDVVRLHNQLRHEDSDNGSTEHIVTPARPPLQLAAAPAEIAERLGTLERAMSEGHTESEQAAERSRRASRLWWAAVVLLAVGIGAAGVVVYRLQRQVSAAAARVSEAERQAELATRTATEQMNAAREASQKLIAEARDTAIRAQTMSDVLAAPDLLRYNLWGGDPAASFNAQVLWSRSRGMVFSGSRLPAPPMNATYQIWLVPAEGEPVTAGTFVPDGSGRFSMATSTPPRVSLPLVGVTVTVETAGGAARPTGRTLLARLPAVNPPVAPSATPPPPAPAEPAATPTP